MPAHCLNNIFSIKACAGEPEKSLSGFDLFDLPGISINQAAQIADADYMTGINLLKDKRRLAILKLKNDLLAYLQSAGYLAATLTDTFRGGDLAASGNITPIGAGWRGMVAYSKKRCGIRRLFISDIYVKVDYTGPLVIRIEEGNGLFYDYNVNVTAGVINVFGVDFSAESEEVRVLIPGTMPAYSVTPNCGCGQSGNDCVKVSGISNGTLSSVESYGVWADIQCRCDYDQLLCALGRDGLFGEVALYLTGVLIMDEAIKTDRLNYFTTYGAEQAAATKREWELEYGEKWNVLIASLYAILPKLDNCGCIDCTGISVRANV